MDEMLAELGMDGVLGASPEWTKLKKRFVEEHLTEATLRKKV